MNKTINVNIGGIFFHMDEEAYFQLKKYLDAISYSLREDEEGRKEILNDIESRISELLSERTTNERQVVNKYDIDEIIKIMGKPEDYHVDDELFEETKTTYRKKNSKKLFRDINHKIIGGVCSGLAHYISVETIWIRLIFILFLFSGISLQFGHDSNFKFGFFPFLLTYVILWIVVPPAKSTSEKLEMKGKPVTIDNIEEKIKEEQQQKVKQEPANQEQFNDKQPKNDPIQYNDQQQLLTPKPALKKQQKSILERLLGFIGSIFLFIFKAITKIIGVLLIIASILGITAVIIGVFSWGSLEYLEAYGNLHLPDEIYGTMIPQWLIVITAFVIAIVPLLGLLYLGIIILSNKSRLFNKNTWLVLIGLWLVALFITVFVVIDVTSQLSTEGSFTESKELPYLPKDTIFVDFSSTRFFSNRNQSYLRRIHLSKDNKARLTITKYSRGKNEKEAVKSAKRIDYSYTVNENILSLNDISTASTKKEKFKNGGVELSLEVPKNSIIKFIKNPSTFRVSVKDIDKDFMNKYYFYKVDAKGIHKSSLINSDEIKPFEITIKRVDNTFTLKSKKGCDWKQLEFTLKNYTYEYVNAYGTDRYENTDIKDSKIANFSFSINKSKNTIRLRNPKGTVWRSLDFTLRDGEEKTINQLGVVYSKS